MSVSRTLAVAIAVAGLAFGTVAKADVAGVPTYTGEDLDRMFGPAPPPVSEPVDKSGPEDWLWVEHFLDRQYARVDADRRYELDRQWTDAYAPRVSTLQPTYFHAAAYGLGYPASVWWNNVAGSYGVRPFYSGHEKGRQSRPSFHSRSRSR